MNSKKIHVFYVLFIVATIILAYGLLSSQSTKHKLELDKIKLGASRDAANESRRARELERPSQVSNNTTTTQISEPIQIRIYSKADSSSQIITTFKGREDLVVTKLQGEWAEVISTRGFPVWVREDLVKTINKGKGYISVSVDRANARASPGLENSTSVGKLQLGDVLKISRKQGRWIRVWSPAKFKGWVKKRTLVK